MADVVNHFALHNKTCIELFWRQYPVFRACAFYGPVPPLAAVFDHPAQLWPGGEVKRLQPSRFERKPAARKGHRIEQRIACRQYHNQPAGRTARGIAHQGTAQVAGRDRQRNGCCRRTSANHLDLSGSAVTAQHCQRRGAGRAKAGG